MYALCWELELAGRYGEALAELRMYKRLTGACLDANHDIYQHWGRIRGRQGKWRLAYAGFVRAVWMRKPDPDDSEVVRRNYRRMTEMRRAAKKRDHADPRSFWLLAAGLHQAGWTELAVDVMYTAARMRPVADAYRNVGEMYEQAFRFPDAVDAYIDGIRDAVRIGPARRAGRAVRGPGRSIVRVRPPARGTKVWRGGRLPRNIRIRDPAALRVRLR